MSKSLNSLSRVSGSAAPAWATARGLEKGAHVNIHSDLYPNAKLGTIVEWDAAAESWRVNLTKGAGAGVPGGWAFPPNELTLDAPAARRSLPMGLVIILEAHGAHSNKKFYPKTKSPNLGSISWTCRRGTDAGGGPRHRRLRCYKFEVGAPQEAAPPTFINDQTEIDDMILSCHCVIRWERSDQYGNEDGLRPICGSTPCSNQTCADGGPVHVRFDIESPPYLYPGDAGYDEEHALPARAVARPGKCDRMGIYICGVDKFKPRTAGDESGSPATALARIDARRHADTYAERVERAKQRRRDHDPILFAPLDEIARSVEPPLGFFALSDLLGWIQYNLPGIIRQYTRGSRRAWSEQDTRRIQQLLREENIKYSLILNVCRPYHPNTPVPPHHKWEEKGSLYQRGTSSPTVGEEHRARAVAALWPGTRAARAAAARAATAGGAGDFTRFTRIPFWQHLQLEKRVAGGHRKLNQRKRGDHRRTNRLRRVRRRRKKTKRRRKRRRRRRRQKTRRHR